MIACDETISVMDVPSTKMTYAIATNVAKYWKYIFKIYILHAVLLVILVLIIAIICYHYTKHRLKQKGIAALTI